jgi:hypothetical protein
MSTHFSRRPRIFRLPLSSSLIFCAISPALHPISRAAVDGLRVPADFYKNLFKKEESGSCSLSSNFWEQRDSEGGV